MGAVGPKGNSDAGNAEMWPMDGTGDMDYRMSAGRELRASIDGSNSRHYEPGSLFGQTALDPPARMRRTTMTVSGVIDLRVTRHRKFPR